MGAPFPVVLWASLTQIGDLSGGKTHSTVLYACQKLETQMKQDADLAEAVQQLCARLKGGYRR